MGGVSMPEQKLPPPQPDPFDTKIRAARLEQANSELRAKGRRRTLLTSPLGDTAPIPLASGQKTLLGQ